MNDDELVSIMAHGIADDQGDAYAEYSSEFDGYARAALAALRASLAGLSTNGINVWGSPADIKAVMRALYSDSIIEDVRTQARHWREYAGKVEAQKATMLGCLNRVVTVLGDGVFDELAADTLLSDVRSLIERLK